MKTQVEIRKEVERLTAPGYVATQAELDSVAADWLQTKHHMSTVYHPVIEDRLDAVKSRIAMRSYES